MGWSYLRLQQYPTPSPPPRRPSPSIPTTRASSRSSGKPDVFLGRSTTRLKNLEQYVVLRPGGDRIGRVYWLMGECYIRLKEYQNADIAISTAVYYEQNNALWWARLGYARELGTTLKWASDAYSQALKLDPGHVDAQRGKDSVDKKLKG